MPPEATPSSPQSVASGTGPDRPLRAVEVAGEFGADRASRRYDRARLEGLFRNTLPAQVAHGIALVVVAWAAYQEVPALLLAGWCGALALVILARSLHVVALLHGRREAALDAWEREYAIGAGVSGSVLGLLAFVTVPSGNPILGLTGAFAITGLVLGAFGTMQASPRAFAAFSTPALSLLFVALVLAPGTGPTLGAAAVLAFTLIIRRLFATLSADSLAALRLRFENEVLATDRAALEVSLHATIEEQDLIFEAATVGILFSIDGRIARCNGSLEQMFGHETGTLEGMGVRALYESDESWRESEARIARSLAERGVHEEDRVFVRANGTPVRCRFSSRSMDRADRGKGSIWVFYDLTEHDQVEAARTRSESRYDLAMSASPAGMWDWDLALDRISYTARFRELLGYSDEQAFRAAFNFRGHLHPEDAARALAAIDRHLAGRVPFRERFRLRRADGAWGWFDASGQAQWDASGRAVRFAGAIADITDLQELVGENQTIFDAAMVGILLTSGQAIRRCNAGLEQMLGYARGELDGHPARVLYAGDADWEQAREALSRGFGERGFHKAELRLRRKDGSLAWCSFSSRPLDPADPDGGAITVCEDITARRQAEDALRASEERMALAFAAADSGVWEWNLAAAHPFYSRRCRELLGYGDSDEEQFARDFDYREHAHPDDRKATAVALRESVMSGRALDHTLRLRTRSGEWRWFHGTGRAVREGGRTIRMVGSITDVTALREREEALIRASMELEASNARLNEAIETIPDGFALFDAADRLVLCNQHYKDLYVGDAQGASPLGMGFEQLLRASLAPGGIGVLPAPYANDLEGWIAERLLRHRNPAPEGYLYQMADGRWIQVRERKTSDGGIVGVRSDVTELKNSEEHIRHLANHDALTGLPNRRLLEDRMKQAFGVARRTRSMLAVMVIDLDRFKQVNDTYGHDVGDMVLLTIASRLRSCVREVDTVARLGGDEFVVLLPQVRESADAMRIAEKIIAEVGKPVPAGGHDHELGASVGISIHPQDGDDAETLLRAADDAMYGVKAAGRNGARFHEAARPAGG